MTLIINDRHGRWISTWHNWDDRPVPQVGDELLIHFGDDNEQEQLVEVIGRVFDGTKPDVIYLTTDYRHD